MAEVDTKNRILDSAEKLFADKGFSATSLRAIIKEAGVNTAAVHYHFGSREALIAAVLTRLVQPVNEERIRLLDAVEAEHPSGPLPLEPILRAFLQPAIQMKYRAAASGNQLPKLAARAIAEPDESLQGTMRGVFKDVFMRFTQAFQRALPNVDTENLYDRFHFMIGAMAFSVVMPNIRHGFREEPLDADELVDKLVPFVAGGLSAPITETTGKGNK